MQSETGQHRQGIASLLHNEITAWLILAISLVITTLGWYISKEYVERRANDRFSFVVEDAVQRIRNRMLEYEQVLRSGVALFDALGRPATRSEWQTFVDRMQIEKSFPGIQGIGYAEMLAPEQLPGHVASVRAEGFADYSVKPEGARDMYSAIVYLEPFDWRNRRAFGYDMYSNPMRRAAMEHARDAGSAAVSGRVVLVQETATDVQAGFLVYLPVYRPGLPHDTVEQRRKALMGYVYSPFRMNDLMRGILGSDTPEVGFELYDETETRSADTLLYDSRPHKTIESGHFMRTTRIPLSGRTWTATFHSSQSFEHLTASSLPELIAGGGLLVDLLLFAIIWSLSTERRRVERRAAAMTADIRETSERLGLAQEAAQIGTWDLDLRTGRLFWDAHMHTLYDVEPGAFSGDISAWRDRVHPEDRSRASIQLQNAIDTLGRFDTVFRVVDRQGHVRFVEARTTVHADESGKAHRLVGINRDITERYELEQKLSLAASVFDHARDGIIISDAERRIVDVNPAFTTVTGYSRDEVLGKTPALLKSGKHDETFYRGMWTQLRETGSWRGEIWNRRKSGELFAQMETISAICDSHGRVSRYIAVFTDITRLLQQQEKLERMAHFDALTGLPNRVLLADRIKHAMLAARRSGKWLAVCYLDLDGFKPVNDRFGHSAGDRLLIEIADRLRNMLRGSDSVARLGGDEFVMLLGDIENLSACETALARLVDGLTDSYAVAEDAVARISASIGVTLFPHDDVDADTLLRHADHAMYLAKEDGRGRYRIFDSEENRQMQARRQTLTRVASALRDDELILHFQPKVNMRTGRVLGAEALLRWNHPQRGLVPPLEFLPLVEDNDLAIEIGTWVIGEVLRQQSYWLADGLEIRVSINISGRHLQQTGFAAELERLLESRPDVPARLIELEVLETTALDDIGRVSEIIGQCRALGVKVSLDDFGTGYSSLTYLRRLPVDTLKIDCSFVRDMLADPEDLAIVEAIIGLSEAFQRQVIAEGVESEEHGKLLLHMGCDLGQGYGIARPMPAAKLPEWVRAYRQPAAWRAIGSQHRHREDLPFHMARFCHGGLVDKVISALESGRVDDVRHLGAETCEFTNWYKGDGAARYGRLDEFRAIGVAHTALRSMLDEALRPEHGGEIADADLMASRLRKGFRIFVDRLNSFETNLDHHDAGASAVAGHGKQIA
ncbi:bifunctional diguanylate cyclase/phosphodiesterase [Cognatazoarcus halotolerans]|uniref:bifunctional diguanylate cyclase/phosphodiesterase n=1 Tax=Cognatazoarcus halotolerans TaxID=2686016 RepID=UPI00135C19F6|nr:EAL domain-containing protein [Cognatazoarcus halotolerans]MCB1901268.1 EAL domain-containing protein [Rhodocyclaceae bacterium]MCP5308339.1 EAL domain-containing protein [Zoogloeaceae bacterium]